MMLPTIAGGPNDETRDHLRCTLGAARSRGSGGRDQRAPDLAAVRAKIKAKDFKGALDELMPMLQSTQHADVYNLIGFSLRKSGDHDRAYTFYRKALELDPEHKGALEYLGELYVETGQVDKAREHVVILKRLCPAGCEELADLEAAIAGSARDSKW
jgi:tetratricopeptide (TPR) repeat protein